MLSQATIESFTVIGLFTVTKTVSVVEQLIESEAVTI